MAPPPPTREDAEAIVIDEMLFGFYVVDSATGARIDPLWARARPFPQVPDCRVAPISSPGGTVEGLCSAVLGLPWEVRESEPASIGRWFALADVYRPDPLLFIGAAANGERS
jgi:hypothetical protein